MAIGSQGVCPLLQVFDMERSLRFYGDVLGFEVAQSSAPNLDWALIRRDQAELMLNTAYEADSRPAKPDPARVAAHVDTALYFGCSDVDDAYRQMRARGID